MAEYSLTYFVVQNRAAFYGIFVICLIICLYTVYKRKVRPWLRDRRIEKSMKDGEGYV